MEGGGGNESPHSFHPNSIILLKMAQCKKASAQEINVEVFAEQTGEATGS